MLRFGPDDAPVVIVAPPLFEEANRTRALLVDLLRRLAARGIAGVLPDLPGTGESLVATEDATIERWREAFEAAVERVWRGSQVAASISIRGGALLDTLALLPARWQLAPMTGEDVRRDLLRTMRAAGFVGDEAELLADDGPPIAVAGNRISRDLWCDLHGALPFTQADEVRLRIVRLATDPRPADHRIDAAPIWRRTEPAGEPMLAEAIAADIAAWIAR